MTRSRFKTCFISAPLGVDTSVVRKTLEEHHIRWLDHTGVKLGDSGTHAIDKALTKTDFVCTILPEGQHSNILFELGVAYARRKPILAFVGYSVDLPTDIRFLTYVRTDLKDPRIFRDAIGFFLRHATDEPLPRISKTRMKGGHRKQGATSPLISTGREFEQRTATLFQNAGYIVSSPTEDRDQGADFAVWIDEVQQSLGNPLLIEVNAGDMSPGRLQQSAAQLRQYVEKTHGHCGLLVYWDTQKREFPLTTIEWPLILQLSGESLTRLIRQRRLAQELVRLRNAAAHGEV